MLAEILPPKDHLGLVFTVKVLISYQSINRSDLKILNGTVPRDFSHCDPDE